MNITPSTIPSYRKPYLFISPSLFSSEGKFSSKTIPGFETATAK
jgi:hypothetical protein